MILTSITIDDFARRMNVPADEVIVGIRLSLCGKIVDIKTEKRTAVDKLVGTLIPERF